MTDIIEPYLFLQSGGKMYPLGPDPDHIHLEDIAHSLASICRYNGHTSEFWSVAAHSIEVCDRLAYAGCRKEACFAGLMHDAAEAYLQDVPRPMKCLMVGYDRWEQNVEYVIAKKFRVQYPYPAAVKLMDHSIVLDEIHSFFPPESAAWQRIDLKTVLKAGWVPSPLLSLTPQEGRVKFLQRAKQYGEGY